MYQPPASGTEAVVETATAFQAVGSEFSLWVAVLGTFSVLLGAGIVLRRRARSTPSEPTTASRPSISSPILTDEERVVRLLESNGGRMRQTRIVERTDWSKSKVSTLLSELEDDGTVHKLRVGRENIISLPGSEPVITQSSGERGP